MKLEELGTLVGAELTAHSRTKHALHVYWQAPEGTGHHLDQVNLLSESARADVVGRLPVEVQEDARLVLGRLAMQLYARQEEIGAAPKGSGDGAVTPAEEEPWPEPVDGAALLDDMVATIRRYLVLTTAEHYYALALWLMFAHGHDAFDFSPLLIATAPERSSGKTRLLEIVSELAPRPWMVLSPSEAVIFRRIEEMRPTLLLDEADNLDWRNRPDLLSMLNGGFQRRTAFVPRCVGEGASLETKDFSVWCPKAIALNRMPLPDTTVSRSIILPMRRKTWDERVEKLRSNTARLVFGPLRRQAARWAGDHIDTLRASDPAMPDDLSDRQADAWAPLVAIGDLAAGPWEDRARKAARVLSKSGEQAEGRGERLLRDIRAVFERLGADRIYSADLAAALAKIEGSPWSEWGKQGFTPNVLAKQLAPFQISPRTVRIGDKTGKGYNREQFADTWRRYVPTQPAQAKSQADNRNTVTGHGRKELTGDAETSRRERRDVRDSELTPLHTEECDGVTFGGDDHGTKGVPCVNPGCNMTQERDRWGMLSCPRCYPHRHGRGAA